MAPEHPSTFGPFRLEGTPGRLWRGKDYSEAITYCESDPPELLEDYRREGAFMDASGRHDPNYKYHPSPKLLTAHEMARINRSSIMRLYWDDDSVSGWLIRLLHDVGHAVEMPADAG